MTSVVLVDDQQLVRDGLRLILELAGIEVLGEAADGEAGARLVLELRPDVVLMDLRMPHVDGIEATRRIVAADSPTSVLVLTTFEGEELTFRALQAGAAGYLLKDAGSRGLDGERPLAPEVVARLVASYVRRSPSDAGARLEPLSDRERDVFALIGAGRSNSEIATELYISGATVKTHVRHILAKLELRDRAQAIVLAHECGLVPDAAPR
jgi:DNA-binding NarL/FixJ family response regulator